MYQDVFSVGKMYRVNPFAYMVLTFDTNDLRSPYIESKMHKIAPGTVLVLLQTRWLTKPICQVCEVLTEDGYRGWVESDYFVNFANRYRGE